MPLINCEINPILTWSKNCVIVKTDKKLHVPILTLSTTQDNAKRLEQLKSGLKEKLTTININQKCQ